MNRLILLSDMVESIEQHLASSSPLEEGVMCLLHAGAGLTGTRFLAGDLERPPEGAWAIQRRDQLEPATWWLSALIGKAISTGAGLLFIHSHPGSLEPPGLSELDYQTFAKMGRAIGPMLDGPLAAAVVHPTGWSGVIWQDGNVMPIDRIQSVGRTLRVLSPVPHATDQEIDIRQRDALGPIQDVLRQLNVAIVGCGGIGSPLAEQLVRMGIGDILLVDHDHLDTPSNVRRVFGSKTADLAADVVPTKVDIVSKHLERIGLDTRIMPMNGDVRAEPVARALLDCDLVLIGTDTHGSRAVVNDLVSAYFLPAIDVGARVGSKLDGSLAGLFAEVRVLTPTVPCLWCRSTIDGGVIAAENLPADEREKRVREGYIVGGVGDPEPSVVALTVLASGLVACALLGMLTEDGSVSPTGYVVDGFLGDARLTGGQDPIFGCRCRTLLGRGDSADVQYLAGIPQR